MILVPLLLGIVCVVIWKQISTRKKTRVNPAHITEAVNAEPLTLLQVAQGAMIGQVKLTNRAVAITYTPTQCKDALSEALDVTLKSSKTAIAFSYLNGELSSYGSKGNMRETRTLSDSNIRETQKLLQIVREALTRQS
jgi:hypothetical protein